MTDYELKNEGKMRSYLSQRIGKKITDEQFDKLIDDFISMASYIYETREGNPFIKESASQEFEINGEWYEVWVDYSFTSKDGEIVAVIDFDYSYDGEDFYNHPH